MRKRTTEAMFRLLRGQHKNAELDAETPSRVADRSDNQAFFNAQERIMIAGVLGMGSVTSVAS